MCVLVSTTCVSADRYKYFWWIGGERIDPSIRSTFAWRAVAENDLSRYLTYEMSYTAWSSGQPDYYMIAGKYDLVEACVMVDSRYNWRWHDIRCYYSLPFVCEIDMKEQK